MTGIDPITKEEREASGLNDDYCTLVFRCNLRRLAGNPYHVDTPFGRAHAVGIGDAFGQIDDLEAALTAAEKRVEALEEALTHIEEYWNGSRTDGAMSDALDEILATARAVMETEK